MRNMKITGRHVEFTDLDPSKLELFTGTHPEFMKKHPYYEMGKPK